MSMKRVRIVNRETGVDVRLAVPGDATAVDINGVRYAPDIYGTIDTDFVEVWALVDPAAPVAEPPSTPGLTLVQIEQALDDETLHQARRAQQEAFEASTIHSGFVPAARRAGNDAMRRVLLDRLRSSAPAATVKPAT